MSKRKLQANRAICSGDKGIVYQNLFDQYLYKGKKRLRRDRCEGFKGSKKSFLEYLNFQAEINRKLIEKNEKPPKQD